VTNAFVRSGQAEQLRFDGFLHVDSDVGCGDPSGEPTVTVIGAKRGNVVTGDGDDVIRVELLSKEVIWSTEFRIVAGGRDDVVEVKGLGRGRERAAGDTTYVSFAIGAKGTWNSSGEGMKRFVDLGAGDNLADGGGADEA